MSNNSENLVLAVDVPENSVSGSTFHVALENRFFEVTVPEGVIPGQTINIIVPQNASVDDASVFQSVEAVREAALAQAKLLNETYKITDKVKQLDETYKVTERAQAISAQAIAKVQEYDAKYDITSKVNSYLSTPLNKTKEIDQTYQITTKAMVIGDRIIAFAREIDAKFALSATSARVVVMGANAIVMAYRRALMINDQHKITERATNMVTKTLDVAQTVHSTVHTVVKERLPKALLPSTSITASGAAPAAAIAAM